MKKIGFLGLWLLLCAVSFAQTTTKDMQRVNAYLLGGVNFSKYMIPGSVTNPLTPMQNEAIYSMKAGGQVGLFADIMINNHWSVEPGLMYSYQRTQSYFAGSYSHGDTTISKEATEWYKTHYAKLPVMINYHFSANENHFVVGLGLYASCALSSKASLDETQSYSTGLQFSRYGNFDPYLKKNRSLYRQIVNDDYVSKLPYSFSDNFYHRFEMGLSVKAGYQISKFYLGFQADFDLLNMANKQFFGNDFSQRDLCLQIMFGYRIN